MRKIIGLLALLLVVSFEAEAQVNVHMQMPVVAADTYFGSTSAGAASFLTWPNCHGSTSAIQYTSGTGLSCGTISSSGSGILALSGDVTASGTGTVPATVAAIQGVAVGTPTGTGNVVFSASPQLSGVVADSGSLTVSGNGAASSPAVIISGTPFTGGSVVTTKPLVDIEASGATAVSSWNTLGEILGFNSLSGYTGNFISAHTNGGSSFFTVNFQGNITNAGGLFAGGALNAGSSSAIGWTSRASITSPANNVIQIGPIDSASPSAQAVQVPSVASGTSNTSGVSLTFNGSKGTGTGAGGSWIFQTAAAGSSGTAQNSEVAVLTLDSTQTAIFGGRARKHGYTVAGLPSGTVGDSAYVSDATACTFNSSPTGGGSTPCPVFYNGTSWVEE